MAATSYKIRGIEPPDLASYPTEVRKAFWGWVVELGIKAKGKEILAGLDKDGKPLRAILPKTRKNRKSEMTPSGKGDPNAPVLIPGWQKSRTYSLLAGKGTSSYAEFFWRYDSWTGNSWGEILAYQAKNGRDVIGLSPNGIALVKVQAWDRWAKWKRASESAKTKQEAPAAKERPAPTAGYVGRKPTPAATYGIGGKPSGKGHGGMTQEEWNAYFRGTASASPPGRPSNPPSRSPIVGSGYNRIIKYTWGQGPRPRLIESAVSMKPRPGPRKFERTGGPMRLIDFLKRLFQ